MTLRPNGQRAWDAETDAELARLWNHGLELIAISRRLHRTKNAIIQRANMLRRMGFTMASRKGALHSFVPKPFQMPPGMRYQDDPRAVCDRGSPWMPPRPDAQSAASSLVRTG